MISTSRQAASRAIMPAIRKFLRYARSAYAHLGSASRIDSNYSPTSTCSLVEKHLDKPGPTGIVNTRRHKAVSQPLYVKGLYSNNAIPIYDQSCCLVVKITSLVFHVSMSTLQHLHSFLAAYRTFLSAGNFSLATSKSCFRLARPLWVVYGRPIREHCKASNAQIDSCRTIRMREWNSGLFNSEVSIPTASFSYDGNGFRFPNYWSMAFDFDVSRSLDMQLARRQQPATVTVFRKRDAVISLRGLITGIANLSCGRTRLLVEERLESVVNSSQHILSTLGILERETSVVTHFRQLFTLIKERYGFTGNFPGADSFLQRCIIQFTSFAELCRKKDGLWLRWIDSIFVSEYQVTVSVISSGISMAIGTGTAEYLCT